MVSSLRRSTALAQFRAGGGVLRRRRHRDRARGLLRGAGFVARAAGEALQLGGDGEDADQAAIAIHDRHARDSRREASWIRAYCG